MSAGPAPPLGSGAAPGDPRGDVGPEGRADRWRTRVTLPRPRAGSPLRSPLGGGRLRPWQWGGGGRGRAGTAQLGPGSVRSGLPPGSAAGCGPAPSPARPIALCLAVAVRPRRPPRSLRVLQPPARLCALCPHPPPSPVPCPSPPPAAPARPPVPLPLPPAVSAAALPLRSAPSRTFGCEPLPVSRCALCCKLWPSFCFRS